MQKAVIFDIDGTLSNNDKRQNILKKDPNNWNKFLEEMGNDPINKEIYEIYNIIKQSNNYKMLIVSGRSDKYKKLTENWLIWNNIEFDELYMRKENDCRSDVEIKKEILNKIKQKYKISFVFDDRSSVVKMWRNEGLICFQCFDHNY